MGTKSKVEIAIDFIAKNGAARTAEIAKVSGIAQNDLASRLYPYVRGGVLVSCRVSQPGKASCNEYRLAGSVSANAWRDFKIGVFSEATLKAKPNRTPPAPVPADRPQVSVKNSGSMQVVPPATGRAVTEKQPHRKAAQPAPGAGGHVAAKPARNIPENIPSQVKFGYFSDGSLRICQCERAIELDPVDAKRLADFLLNCMISAEVNA